MEFNPGNKVVKLCLQGMAMEEKGLFDDAAKCFQQAWSEAKYDFEKFISAHYVARRQNNVSEKLEWLEKALSFGLEINDDSTKSALPTLYSDIAECHEAMGDIENANINAQLAKSISDKPSSFLVIRLVHTDHMRHLKSSAKQGIGQGKRQETSRGSEQNWQMAAEK